MISSYKDKGTNNSSILINNIDNEGEYLSIFTALDSHLEVGDRVYISSISSVTSLDNFVNYTEDENYPFTNYNTGYEVIGVSADSQKRQLNFALKNELPYSLLVDEEKKVIKAYGVWGPKKFMGREYDGIHRTTFIIDEKGLIENIITKVKTKEHTAQIL